MRLVSAMTPITPKSFGHVQGGQSVNRAMRIFRSGLNPLSCPMFFGPSCAEEQWVQEGAPACLSPMCPRNI